MDVDAGPDELRHRFTVDEVMEMARAGFFEDKRLELLEGDLLEKEPGDPPHAWPVEELTMRLTDTYRERFRVRVQGCLQLSTHSLPEPDLLVLRGDGRTFARRHPMGSDCVLVVEVSHTSRRRDLRKVGLYAVGGVPVYWRLDVPSRTLEVYERPQGEGGYASVRVLQADDEVDVPQTQVRWKVADLLP